MYRKTIAGLLLGTALAVSGGVAAAPAVQDDKAAQSVPDIQIDIPYEKFVLPNGLRVVVHTDRKAPVVNINVWYHVGSKDEPKGRSGFAHLFEHLMFNGTENYDDEFFKPFQDVGATGMNGTTNADRTNYYETIPTPALDMALWMESDRMGHLLGAVTQEKLDEQRGVVQNEKRQGENQPYGLVYQTTLEGLFPSDHPYHHTVIGSMEDLNAASLEDVHTWFKTYYGAANAVLVLSGDIDVETARPLVEKYFGDVKSGPALTKKKAWVASLEDNKYDVMQDQVPNVRMTRTWVVPNRNDRDYYMLDVATTVLGTGETSRLRKALVDTRLATSAQAWVQPGELSSGVVVQVNVAPGVDENQVSKVVDEVMAEFLENGPTADELYRAKMYDIVSRTNSLEQVGAKAQVLAQGEIYAGDPGFHKISSDWVMGSTTADIRDTSAKWLTKGYYQLSVRPFKERDGVETTADRSKLPEVADLPALNFPDVVEGELANGMKVVLAERHDMPKVRVAVEFDAGHATTLGKNPGLMTATMGMLSRGTTSRSAAEISETNQSLGSSIGAGAGLDQSSVTLTALTPNLKPSLELMADVMMNPAFDQSEMDRMRPRWVASFRQQQAQPVFAALKNLPELIYGKNHPYAGGFAGFGSMEAIQALTVDELRQMHQDWIRPDNGTIFVVGDTTMDEILPMLNDTVGKWAAPAGDKPRKMMSTVDLPSSGRVVIIDKPGAVQSLIMAGQVVPSTGDESAFAFDAANTVLGGQFTARLNMNLREDKGWSYGAFTFSPNAKGQRPWMIYAPVQTDKTKESIEEILKEVGGFTGEAPATQDELDVVVRNKVRELPGKFEAASAVMTTIRANARHGRPYDYDTRLPAMYGGLTVDNVQNVASEDIALDRLTWVIVGDREKIEEGIRALELGSVEVRESGE